LRIAQRDRVRQSPRRAERAPVLLADDRPALVVHGASSGRWSRSGSNMLSRSLISASSSASASSRAGAGTSIALVQRWPQSRQTNATRHAPVSSTTQPPECVHETRLRHTTGGSRSVSLRGSIGSLLAIGELEQQQRVVRVHLSSAQRYVVREFERVRRI